MQIITKKAVENFQMYLLRGRKRNWQIEKHAFTCLFLLLQVHKKGVDKNIRHPFIIKVTRFRPGNTLLSVPFLRPCLLPSPLQRDGRDPDSHRHEAP